MVNGLIETLRLIKIALAVRLLLLFYRVYYRLSVKILEAKSSSFIFYIVVISAVREKMNVLGLYLRRLKVLVSICILCTCWDSASCI